MEPVGNEVSIYNLIPGEIYYGFSADQTSRLRGIFTNYWRNQYGYLMVHFNHSHCGDQYYYSCTGEFEAFNEGCFFRVFENYQQCYVFYNASRFTEIEKKGLLQQYLQREQRQYARGLISSRLPMDIVHKIITYL